MKRVVGIAGSFRTGSYSTKLLKAFQEQTPEGYELVIVDISKLPLFNEDLETNVPDAVNEFKQSIEPAAAVLIVTPEYNRSYPPALKNALDWGSRRSGIPDHSVWARKPVAIAGCSPFALGGFGAVHHIRQVLVYLDMLPLQQPEFYLGNALEKMDENGVITDPPTHERVVGFWHAFVELIEKNT